MANNVETKMWLVSSDQSPLSQAQVTDFFSQFISIDQEAEQGEESRLFDFNFIIPQPENIWLGSVGGYAEMNIELIEDYGGLDAVKQALKANKHFPIEHIPVLTEEQIIEFGMVNGLDWRRKNWGTKWGAYDCSFDWSGSYESGESAHVSFCTAWSVPETILRIIRDIALKKGFDIACVFGGELDCPGEYIDGEFMYWDSVWNNETHEFERQGDPMDVHK